MPRKLMASLNGPPGGKNANNSKRPPMSPKRPPTHSPGARGGGGGGRGRGGRSPNGRTNGRSGGRGGRASPFPGRGSKAAASRGGRGGQGGGRRGARGGAASNTRGASQPSWVTERKAPPRDFSFGEFDLGQSMHVVHGQFGDLDVSDRAARNQYFGHDSFDALPDVEEMSEHLERSEHTNRKAPASPLSNKSSRHKRKSKEAASTEKDGDDNGSSKTTEERFVLELGKLGITPNIEVDEEKETKKPSSEITFSDESYILDLARQKETRKKDLQEEALDDALVIYKQQLKDGQPESDERFLTLVVNAQTKLTEEYKKYWKEQDVRLDRALQEELDRRARESTITLDVDEGKDADARGNKSQRVSAYMAKEHDGSDEEDDEHAYHEEEDGHLDKYGSSDESSVEISSDESDTDSDSDDDDDQEGGKKKKGKLPINDSFMKSKAKEGGVRRTKKGAGKITASNADKGPAKDKDKGDEKEAKEQKAQKQEKAPKQEKDKKRNMAATEENIEVPLSDGSLITIDLAENDKDLEKAKTENPKKRNGGGGFLASLFGTKKQDHESNTTDESVPTKSNDDRTQSAGNVADLNAMEQGNKKTATDSNNENNSKASDQGFLTERRQIQFNKCMIFGVCIFFLFDAALVVLFFLKD